MPFTSEEEMLQEISDTVQKQTGLVLDLEQVRGLLLEVQKEQLKGLVYRAFMAVNQAREEVPGPEVVENVTPTVSEQAEG